MSTVSLPCRASRTTGETGPLIARIGLRIRYNSSSAPSKSDQKPLTASDPSQTSITTPAPAASKPKSIIARLTALTSLKGATTSGETGHSSVAKLVELAKPESRQLAIAVGLVSPPLSLWRMPRLRRVRSWWCRAVYPC